MAEPIKKTKPKKPAPALTLSTTDFDRQSVAIDGVMYEIRAQEELNVPMLKSFNRLARDIDIEDQAAVIGKLDELNAAVLAVMVG